MRRALAASIVVAALAGCLFPDLSGLDTSGGDAQSDVALDVNVLDVADAATPMCDPSKPFTSITPIAELNDADDQFKPTLTPDELEIWYGFTHTFDGGETTRILHAKRSSVTAPFGTPVVEANLAPDDVVDPGVTDDGLGLYFCRSGSVGDFDLFEAVRPTRNDAFGIGAQLPLAIQSTSNEIAPFVAFDGSLFFASARSGEEHIWQAPFVDGGLGAPALDPSLSSPSGESDIGATLTHDGLWAYVSSTRSDATSFGSYDIFLTHRATAADAFGPVTNVTELNSASFDRADWISWDGCRLYFESSRDSTTGNGDLFLASKVP